MRWADIPFRPAPRMLRQFAGLWLLLLSAVAVWQWLVHERTGLAIALAVIAIAGGVPGLFRPAAIRPLFIACMVITFPIGWVVSRVILATVYYGLFTPIGWLFRWSGRDALRMRRRDSATTYWEMKPQAADPKQYFRQY